MANSVGPNAAFYPQVNVQPFPAPGANLGAPTSIPSLPGAPYLPGTPNPVPQPAPNAFPGAAAMATLPPDAIATGHSGTPPGAPGYDAAPNSNAASQYTITNDLNIISATDRNNGDVIAYARPTKSYLAKDGATGITLYGYGNGAFGMQNATQDISLAVAQNGESTLCRQGRTIALGKITNPHVLTALVQLFGGKAANDISVAFTTKDLERTSVGASFPYSVVRQLAVIQGHDNYDLTKKTLQQSAAQRAVQNYGQRSMPSYAQPAMPGYGQPTVSGYGSAAASGFGATRMPSLMNLSRGNPIAALNGNDVASTANPFADDGSAALNTDAGNPFQPSANSNPFEDSTNPNPFGDQTGANQFSDAPNPYAEASSNPFADSGSSNPFADSSSSNPFADSSSSNPFADSSSSNPFADSSSSNPFADSSSSNPFADSSNSNPFADSSSSNPFADSSSSNPFADSDANPYASSPNPYAN